MTFFCQPIFCQAQTAAGITIAPAIQQLELRQDESDVKAKLKIKNTSTQEFQVKISFRELSNPDDLQQFSLSDNQTGNKLADWVHFDQTELSVVPGSETEIAYSLENSSELSPGSHYGLILAELNQGKDETSSSINLRQVMSSIVLIKKIGGEKYSLKFNKLITNFFFWQLPEKVESELKNDGNVHLIPRGVVEMQDWTGRQVAKATLNNQSKYIYPDSVKTISAELKPTASVKLPGLYKLIVKYRYDEKTEFETWEKHFIYLNIWQCLLLLTIVITSAIIIKLLLKKKAAAKQRTRRKAKP